MLKTAKNILYYSFGSVYHLFTTFFTKIFTIILKTDILLPDISAFFFVFILSVLFTFAYIKVRYPFWNIQPVFHTYDIWRYAYTMPFIIRKAPLPMKTKYCDFLQIQTYNYLETTLEQRNNIIDLLRCYYVPSDQVLCILTEPILTDYMTGHNEPTYISLYREKQYALPDSSANIQIKYADGPVGCIISRPLHLYINMVKIDAYFLDYICSHRDYQKKHISRNLIQTHEYNQRDRNPNIQIGIFKKESHLCEGVVPFVKYPTYTFPLKKIGRIPRLPPHFTIEQIHKQNLGKLADFFANLISKNGFTFLGITDMAVISTLITTNQWSIYCMLYNDDVYGYYFFKNANTQYEGLLPNTDDCDTLQFTASFSNTESLELFYIGFLHSLKQITKAKKTYKMMLFETISHNSRILVNWRKENQFVAENPTAYYLYNFVLPRSPLSQEQCFLVL
jgi:hypothetical protein